MTSMWIKIGEVRKIKSSTLFKEYNAIYAVFERVKDNGMREYKEVYMASDSYSTPKLNSIP